MAIKKIELYVVECDSCGSQFNEDEYWLGFETEDEAAHYACGCASWVEGGEVFCEDCLDRENL
mgnify:FL=1